MANPSFVKYVKKYQTASDNAAVNLNCDVLTNVVLLAWVVQYRSGGGPDTPTSVKYNDVSMTLVTTQLVQSNMRMACYRLVNPTQGSTVGLVATYASTQTKISLIGVQFQTVNQTTPIDAYGSEGNAAFNTPKACHVTSSTNNTYPIVGFFTNKANVTDIGAGTNAYVDGILDNAETDGYCELAILSNHAVQASAGEATINVTLEDAADSSAYIAVALGNDGSGGATTIPRRRRRTSHAQGNPMIY